mmetsp:Transcript_24997/g.36906  ORF Transcript_24997/g.36906 Transcript_24997/m.36906 type:complete len:356 (+) Transcript_24997:156-1223(+)|eukprot:CAMPEP_0185020770 /NCGR_PEP_ID=MMETSP1103-20130426/3415_1 /TAXON_ID=36769 /ORGANISM="Paraphysomonas bandaiensis, Strain Caron Lab Isolate" /LENGTH=355 /DNA_ID=CAMNT_0027551881 /DNA_START=89 /DNA_END=1156 /DNA_ORIENTATION=+
MKSSSKSSPNKKLSPLEAPVKVIKPNHPHPVAIEDCRSKTAIKLPKIQTGNIKNSTSKVHNEEHAIVLKNVHKQDKVIVSPLAKKPSNSDIAAVEQCNYTGNILKPSTAIVDGFNGNPKSVESLGDRSYNGNKSKVTGEDNCNGRMTLSPAETFGNSLSASCSGDDINSAHRENSQAADTQDMTRCSPCVDQPCRDGKVKIVYEMYREEFDISNGVLLEFCIDDTYCLSDVMPNCTLELSILSPQEIRDKIVAGASAADFYVQKEEGKFTGLEAGVSYYCYVKQDEQEILKEQRGRQNKYEYTEKNDNLERDDGRGFDTCTCIYGTPCTDEYGCRDWRNRFTISTANGWKGSIEE